MADAVALDLDDTLFLERDFVRSGFRAVGLWVAEHIGHQCDWSATLWQGFEQGVRGDAFNRVHASAGVAASPELIEQLLRCYREHRPDIVLPDDVLPALDSLALPPGRLGVITDGPVVMQRNKWDALGIASRKIFGRRTSGVGPLFGSSAPAGFMPGGRRCRARWTASWRAWGRWWRFLRRWRLKRCWRPCYQNRVLPPG